MSTHPARRRQLRTWTPADRQEHLQAVATGMEQGSKNSPELLDLASNDYFPDPVGALTTTDCP